MVRANNVAFIPLFASIVSLITKAHSSGFGIRNSSTVDPCQDFYEFSCGSKTYPQSPWELAENGLRSDIIELLREGPSQDDDHLLSQVKILYKSCNDRYTLNMRKHLPLLKLIESLGGFQLLRDEWKWPTRDEDFVEILVKLRRLGLNYNHFFRISVEGNPEDNSENIIHLRPIESPRYRMSVVRHFPSILGILGLDNHGLDNALKGLNEVEKFINELPKVNKNEGHYQIVELNQLELVAPNIDWLRLLQKFTEVAIDRSEKLAIWNIEKFGEIDNLIKFTCKDTLENYIFLNLIDELGSKLGGPISEYVSNEPPECTEVVQNYLGLALMHVYVRKGYVNEQKLDSAIRITHDIKASFIKAIDESSWMDDVSKLRSKEKVEWMSINIGYPDQLKNLSMIEELYEDMSLDPSMYFENLISIRKIRTDQEFARLYKSAYDLKWMTFTPITHVNAYYYREFNLINLLPGLLDSHFLYPKGEIHFNYGALGSIIGHEMSHAFDLNCISNDARGNSINLTLWSDSHTRKEYKDRIECLISQYNELTSRLSHIQMDGSETVNENLADLCGYDLAYRAFVSSLEMSTLNSEMKRKERKLFWLSGAGNWCTDRGSNNQDKNDPHSPKRLRVNMAISNLDSFSSDYNCPPGTPMNPMKKCKFW